jgi:hypothetical protein
MKRFALVVLALNATPALAGDDSPSAVGAFVMPSGNVACLVQEVDLETASTPQPQLVCVRLEPAQLGAFLDERGAYSRNKPRVPQLDWNAPVLNYGENFWHDDFSCDSLESGVECSHPKYGAFRLSKKGMKRLR